MEENVVSSEVEEVTPVVAEDEETEDEEEVGQYDPNVDSYVEGLEESRQPTEPIETFKIDENMPPELKAQLERFNRQTENLNAIMNSDTSGDEPLPDPGDDEVMEDDGEEESEEATSFDIQEDESVQFGNLF